MVSHILSQLSHLKHVAFALPKTSQILCHFHISNDGNFKLHKWAGAFARAFCNLPDGYDIGTMKPDASALGSKYYEPDDMDIAIKKMKRILSRYNVKFISDISSFPQDVLECENKIYELFEAWMCGRIYPTPAEKMRRFEAFKKSVFKVQKMNAGKDSGCIGLTRSACNLPGDPIRRRMFVPY